MWIDTIPNGEARHEELCKVGAVISLLNNSIRELKKAQEYFTTHQNCRGDNNASFHSEIIEKGNADFIFLYRHASGVTELIHSQPMPECYGELDDWLSQLPPKARFAVYYSVQENIRSLGITLRLAEIIYRNSKGK